MNVKKGAPVHQQTNESILDRYPAGACARALHDGHSLAVMVEVATARGVVLRTLDGDECITSRDLFQEWARVLGFPDYFGINYDAFDEVMCDREFTPRTATLLVIRNPRRIMDVDRPVERGAMHRTLCHVHAGLEHSNYAGTPQAADYPPFWLILACRDKNEYYRAGALYPAFAVLDG